MSALKRPPSVSQTTLSFWLPPPILATKKHFTETLLCACCCFSSCAIRVREPGNLSTNRKLLNLWICDSVEGFFHEVWELQRFKKCFSALPGQLLQLFNNCLIYTHPDASRFFDMANMSPQLFWLIVRSGNSLQPLLFWEQFRTNRKPFFLRGRVIACRSFRNLAHDLVVTLIFPLIHV